MPSVIGQVTFEPIKVVRVQSQQGATPSMKRTPEAALQTFQIGVPMRMVSGFLQEVTFAAADTIWGVSGEKAHNYPTANAILGLPPIIPTALELNDPAAGPAPNQPSGAVIPMGAAIRDANIGSYDANGQTVFSIALKLGQVFTQGLVIPGTLYGLTKDATSGFWFLDTTVTVGNSAVANLLDVDHSCPNDPVLGSRVFFMFAQARRAFA